MKAIDDDYIVFFPKDAERLADLLNALARDLRAGAQFKMAFDRVRIRHRWAFWRGRMVQQRITIYTPIVEPDLSNIQGYPA